MKDNYLNSIILQMKKSVEQNFALPFSIYSSNEFYEYEKQFIFEKEWIAICPESKLKNTGEYFACNVAGESIIIVRGKDNKLRALSNACKHRGTMLVDEGYGKITRNFVCPYHSWSYSDTGKLVNAPTLDMNNAEASIHCLPEFSLEVWFGVVFVNFDKAAESLISRLKPLDSYLKLYESRFDDFNDEAFISEEWKSNWKVGYENALEVYHILSVHKDSLEGVAPAKKCYFIESAKKHSVMGGFFKPIEDLPNIKIDFIKNNYIQINIFPAFVAVIGPSFFMWLTFIPTYSPQCSNFFLFSRNPECIKEQIKEIMTQGTIEDRVICEKNQKGMNSRHASSGKLVEMEKYMIPFHNYLIDMLECNHSSVNSRVISEASNYITNLTSDI